MVTHYEVVLWHNMIGRLLKSSLPSEIRPPFYSWNLDTTLFRTGGNSAANQRSHFEFEPETSNVQASLIVILADVIKSGWTYLPQQSAVYIPVGGYQTCVIS